MSTIIRFVLSTALIGILAFIVGHIIAVTIWPYLVHLWTEQRLITFVVVGAAVVLYALIDGIWEG